MKFRTFLRKVRAMFPGVEFVAVGKTYKGARKITLRFPEFMCMYHSELARYAELTESDPWATSTAELCECCNRFAEESNLTIACWTKKNIEAGVWPKPRRKGKRK